MTRFMRKKSESGYYHIMLRGNERKNIFNDDEDKQRFTEILFEKKQGERFYLHAFCFMDNHIHLMMSLGSEDISKVMKRITVSYVYYFNKKYKRVGHLFQDRYKSETIEEESYMLALSRYIHMNPVKAGVVKDASEYKWSSYRDYIGQDEVFAKILDAGAVLNIISEDRQAAVNGYIEYMKEEAADSFNDIVEENGALSDEAAKELFDNMLSEYCTEGIGKGTNPELTLLIKDFRAKTNLSIRKIAAIAGINKDRINKILKS